MSFLIPAGLEGNCVIFILKTSQELQECTAVLLFGSVTYKVTSANCELVQGCNFRTAAYLIAIERIAASYRVSGIFP